MQRSLSLLSTAVLAAITLTTFLSSAHAFGQTETVLYSFSANGTDGYDPFGSLIPDAAGNLCGTTQYGGAHDVGTVFEFSPQSDGTWTEQILYSFGGGEDGQYPAGSVIFDNAGNLYCTTQLGGALLNGTVYELSPHGDGAWTESVLHSFGAGTAGRVLDSASSSIPPATYMV